MGRKETLNPTVSQTELMAVAPRTPRTPRRVGAGAEGGIPPRQATIQCDVAPAFRHPAQLKLASMRVTALVNDTGTDKRHQASPEVSVVMPSYNSGPFLRTAISSVLSNSEPTLELLIQDGQSKDETMALVDSYPDPRLSFVSEPDAGQSDAVNRAIERARGNWILWLNADDALTPDGLSRLWEAVTPDCDVVHGDWALIDEQGGVIRRYRCAPLDHQRLLRYGSYVYNGAVLVRRSVFDRVGVLDTTLDYCMDFDLLLRISRVASVRSCGELVALFRIQPDSKSARRAWSFALEGWQVAGRYGAFRPRRLPRTLFTHFYRAAYRLTRPLWRSQIWRRVRPEKSLGGGR